MEETRVCSACGEERPITDYHSAGTKNGKRYRRKKCRDCYRLVKKKYRDRKSNWLKRYKESLACSSCGYSKNTHDNFSHRALEFHHHNDDKEFNVSEGVFIGYSQEKIIKEINKCTVLCSRCHAEKHDNQNDKTK